MANQTEPQSCYPDEIKTLREMLADELERMDMLADRSETAAIIYSRAVSARRLEALATAIEALGGVL